MHIFSYKYDQQEHQILPYTLRSEDFLYFQRSTETLLLTDTFSSRSSSEARHLGLNKTEYKSYVSRVRMLEQAGVSTPIGVALLHVGLNVVLYLYINESRETTERVIRACQLLPCVIGYVLEDGSGVLMVYVPNSTAVEVHSSLRKILAEQGIDSQIAIKPSWQGFRAPKSPIRASNYDFKTGEWLWKSENIPKLEE